MPKTSAGLLVYRVRGGNVEVLLAHPGGPFWVGKDEGAWSVPKGEYAAGSDALEEAKREFKEETGIDAPAGRYTALTPVKQPSGKIVSVWSVESDPDISNTRSNPFSMEWPPGSGKLREFPEVDRVEWFGLDAAVKKIFKGQAPLIEELVSLKNMNGR